MWSQVKEDNKSITLKKKIFFSGILKILEGGNGRKKVLEVKETEQFVPLNKTFPRNQTISQFQSNCDLVKS